MSNVLVVAAHPDDEIIGCGGSLARHCAAGDTVNIVFLADGEGSRIKDPHQIWVRQNMAHQAAKIIGCCEPKFLSLPDNQLDTLPFLELVQAIEQATNSLSPDIIYTHHGGDLNIDHRLACQATLTAFRPQPNCNVKAIYAFDITSSTEWSHPSVTSPFTPQRFHNISDWRSIKELALRCYDNEMRAAPHSRSIENIHFRDQYRGHSIGCQEAEAFMVLREIW